MQPLRWWAFVNALPPHPRHSRQFDLASNLVYDYTQDVDNDHFAIVDAAATCHDPAAWTRRAARGRFDTQLPFFAEGDSSASGLEAPRQTCVVLPNGDIAWTTQHDDLVPDNYKWRHTICAKSKPQEKRRHVGALGINELLLTTTTGHSDSSTAPKTSDGSRRARGTQGSRSDETEESDVATTLKRIKAEERRMRNRESAYRSNARKRAVREALQKELCRERGRLCELRMRMKMLQEENGRLRNAVCGSGEGKTTL